MSADAPRAAPRHFGSGWISGTLSVVLAGIGLGAVFCFHFPSYLTLPEYRALYPLPLVRAVLHLVLVGGFLLGLTSIMLRHNKTLGLVGMGLVLIAALLGGSRVQIQGALHDDYYMGLDYFLLNIIVFSLIFVPLEKLFGRLNHGVFRKGWRTDLIYFFVGSVLIQVITLLTLKPAFVLFGWAVNPSVQAQVRSQPLWAQFLEFMLLADVMEYWVHRMFHVVPWLWRFHAVHHSAEVMDWLAASRLHVVDLAVTRAAMYVPAFILGFSDMAFYAYIGFVSIHATFIHSNVRFSFGPLRWVLATPQFHHWHHGCEAEAIDKNFAVHLPFLDWFFGTLHLPGLRWPKVYGVHNNDVPAAFWAQWLYPFLPAKKQASPSPGPLAIAPTPSSGERRTPA
jgi:sterol desaturase/sphingolipid hydroxylase (fatty acid hydroxylase superfamily)